MAIHRARIGSQNLHHASQPPPLPTRAACTLGGKHVSSEQLSPRSRVGSRQWPAAGRPLVAVDGAARTVKASPDSWRRPAQFFVLAAAYCFCACSMACCNRSRSQRSAPPCRGHREDRTGCRWHVEPMPKPVASSRQNAAAAAPRREEKCQSRRRRGRHSNGVWKIAALIAADLLPLMSLGKTECSLAKAESRWSSG